ncbi:MAG: complement resistance protein TraT [Francisellaceae bacterium]|nr:complement resistance protein TraT [Francisellaceae bacterium]
MLLLPLMVGCGAAHTTIQKRNLDVQTKMSATLFLDPVSEDKRTIFVQVKNTSDKSSFDIESQVKEALAEKGYKVINNPEKAHYLLQANVLYVGRADLRAAESALHGGYGGAIGGAVVGASVGSIGHHHHDNALVGGLIGAAVGTLADAMVSDVVYSVISDIQVSERVSKAFSVREKTKSKLVQGTSGAKEVTSTEKTNWKRYQTRIISTANKVNLKLEAAQPALVSGLTRSIAGIF